MKKIYNRRNGVFVTLLLVVVVILSACGPRSSDQSTSGEKASAKQPSTDEPMSAVVFIHGYNGSENSMAPMIKRLAKKEKSFASGVTFTIEPNGSYEKKGEFVAHKKNLVNVVYADSQTEAATEGEQLATVMSALREAGIKTVDFVAHSMGGTTITYYLESQPDETKVPKVEKFVAIGTPFAWAGTAAASENNVLEQNKVDLPTNLSVYGIIGNVGDESDGTVPYADAHFAKRLFANYQEAIITGDKAAHSKLRNNDKVDEIILRFLTN
ncbi:hypothetical protein BFR38_08755 [Brochothrix thermosphacta]|uniref:alpha/beta hydrolase n=1 Tax=Brochothrix thermosphacta TaxID=2756 RepID=UPI00083F5459|nr:alpha/beta hydrolase [Brochothrix thermosphacta]ODJ55482.1 hypothetical protein BFR38_08755 [Brochothrix thermosphacta]ODJ61404.1 hypothetical protein BFR42_08845 [Brochothrix thermosphacta]